MNTDKTDQLSDVERIKSSSEHLRGTLAEGLVDPVHGSLAEDDTQLSKFHGIYQQDDRDRRNERKRQKLDRAYSFMIRARLPGGICTTDQWLAIDELADSYANSTFRLTTRQAFQFHGVVKRELRQTVRKINESLLDTLAACGDVNRNVMCSPNPYLSSAHGEVQYWADKISDHLTPRTTAYHDIWLDGEKLAPTSPVLSDLHSQAASQDKSETVEPVYGDTYLPRKFKTGLVIPPQNDVDVFTQDLGFIAIVEDGSLRGFNVTVGGGMGSSHGDVKTYPRLADNLGFIVQDDVLAVAAGVVTTQRDFGDRSDRKHARLKYTIDDRGLEWFRSEVEARSGVKFESPRAAELVGTGDRLGWSQGEDQQWHFTLFVDSGRISDGQRLVKTGMREIAKIHQGEIRFTPNQNLIISNVAPENKPAIEALLAEYSLHAPVSVLASHAMACVALPSCGLAMAEAERYLPDLVERVNVLLDRHGLNNQPIVLRMTGCPNGCARPFVAEIALVGKAPGRYNLYLGGGHHGERLNKLFRENIDESQILSELDSLFESYAKNRQEHEAFGDFCIRSGAVQATTAGQNFHDHTPLDAA